MKKQDVSVGTRKNAWLLSNRPAIRHADRFANTGCLLSSEGDDVVAAFAVYVRVNISLPACGHASAFNLHVRAWLIASRKKILSQYYAGTGLKIPAVPPGLVHTRTHSTRTDIRWLLITERLLRLTYLRQ